MPLNDLNFDVVLSFAGEDRDKAEIINDVLKTASISTFYDDDYRADLWGKVLTEALHDVYFRAGKYCVMIVSKYYLAKMWPRHERRAALSRMIREKNEYVLPYISDRKVKITDVEGLNPDTAYLSVPKFEPVDVAHILISKLRVGLKGAPYPARAEAANFILDRVFEICLDVNGEVLEPYEFSTIGMVPLMKKMFFQHYPQAKPYVFHDALDWLIVQNILHLLSEGEAGPVVEPTALALELRKYSQPGRYIGTYSIE